MIAARNGRLEAVQLLLRAGADKSCKTKIGDTALTCAQKGFDKWKKYEDAGVRAQLCALLE